MTMVTVGGDSGCHDDSGVVMVTIDDNDEADDDDDNDDDDDDHDDDDDDDDDDTDCDNNDGHDGDDVRRIKRDSRPWARRTGKRLGGQLRQTLLICGRDTQKEQGQKLATAGGTRTY